MQYGFQSIVSHVSGTRQIAQGSDGLSRGELNEGVMNGIPFSVYLNFHKTAIERSPLLLDWINAFLCDSYGPATLLTPSDWFVLGHDIVGGSISDDGM